MAAFGLPGGMELWIIAMVGLVYLVPIALIVLVVWLVMKRKSANAVPASPAGWLADPTGRHELRYWNGAAWSDHVSDAGVQSEDPA